MSGPDAFGMNPYYAGAELSGRIVMVLEGSADDRGLVIEPFRSRALQAQEIHELMLTDEPAGPNGVVNRVALLGFFEIFDGGVATTRSEVLINGQLFGRILGFDQTHFPNHLNICLFSTGFADGVQLGIQPGDRVTIRLPE